MPRKQTVHLIRESYDEGEDYWCRGPMGASASTIPEATCEPCLKAAAEFGRQVLARAFELDFFQVPEEKE